MTDIVLRQKGLNSAQSKAKAQIVPGVILYGYCGGRFGRDSYGEKIVIRVNDDNTILAEEDGRATNSFEIKDWVALIEDSNEFLKGIEELEEENE
jgi:hypothetical protein